MTLTAKKSNADNAPRAKTPEQMSGSTFARSASWAFAALWKANDPSLFPNALASPEPVACRLAVPIFAISAIFLLCVGLRAVLGSFLGCLCPDGVLYIRLASMIEDGRFAEGFAEMKLNVYPVILMMMHRLGFSWEMGGIVWGVLASSLVVFPLFGWVRRQFDDRVALLSCLLYAVHPIFIQWSPELIRDSSFWLLMSIYLYTLWRAVTEIRFRWFVAAGLSFGLAVLARFEGFFLVVPLFFWTLHRLRYLHDKNLRRRLVQFTVLPIVVLLVLMFIVNLVCLGGRQWVGLRMWPVELIGFWWKGVFASSAAKANAAGAAANLNFVEMVQIYVPAIVKGLSPFYALAMLLGLWFWRRVWLRCDQQPLFYTSLIVLLAAWIHAWNAHESVTRYYLPIVLMALPYIALACESLGRGLSNLCNYFRIAVPPVRVAAIAPFVVMVLTGPAIAFSDNFQERAAVRAFGEWVCEGYGENAKLLGSEGVTTVAAHYAHASQQLVGKSMEDEEVVRIAQEQRPDVILLLECQRKEKTNWPLLTERLSAQGFSLIEAGRLPRDLNPGLIVYGRQKNEPPTLAGGQPTEKRK